MVNIEDDANLERRIAATDASLRGEWKRKERKHWESAMNLIQKSGLKSESTYELGEEGKLV
jgi:hypothetical protein